VPTLLKPRYWGGHLLMLLALASAIGLGVWQYSAWGAHRDAKAQNLTHAKAVALASVMTGDSPFPGNALGRPVTFNGRWLPQGTLYVSDRFHGKHRGFWVVTPVLVQHAGRASAMPVVRGWSATPRATPPSGPVRITGWLQASEGSDVPDPNPNDDVIPEMRVASIVQHVDADLYSGYVVQRSATPDRHPVTAVGPDAVPPVSSFTALRNLLYAFEWWFFGGFAVFVWVRWCGDQLADEAASEEEPDEAADGETAAGTGADSPAGVSGATEA
jgi:cytochrome oxidase assembly protein ShyY1